MKFFDEFGFYFIELNFSYPNFLIINIICRLNQKIKLFYFSNFIVKLKKNMNFDLISIYIKYYFFGSFKKNFDRTTSFMFLVPSDINLLLSEFH